MDCDPVEMKFYVGNIYQYQHILVSRRWSCRILYTVLKLSFADWYISFASAIFQTRVFQPLQSLPPTALNSEVDVVYCLHRRFLRGYFGPPSPRRSPTSTAVFLPEFSPRPRPWSPTSTASPPAKMSNNWPSPSPVNSLIKKPANVTSS